jgi:hypothetical protein
MQKSVSPRKQQRGERGERMREGERGKGRRRECQREEE